MEDNKTPADGKASLFQQRRSRISRLFRNMQEKSDAIERSAQCTGQIEIEIQLVTARFAAMMINAMIEEEGVGPIPGSRPTLDMSQEAEQSQPEGGVEEKDGIEMTTAHQTQQPEKS